MEHDHFMTRISHAGHREKGVWGHRCRHLLAREIDFAIVDERDDSTYITRLFFPS